MTSSEVPGNLAIRDGLSWTPSLFISARLSCAFVDGPGSWASMAVAWVQSNRSSTKTFFKCRIFLAQACLLESPVLERKSEWKTSELESFLWYYFSWIWCKGMEQRKTVGFVPLVSPWKKNRRNSNFHFSSFSYSYSSSTRLRDSSIIAL